MGLKTLVSRGGFHAELAAYVRGDDAGTSPRPLGFSWDPVIASFSGVPLSYGVFPLEATQGHLSRYGDDSMQELMRSKPNTVPFNGSSDNALYGGLMSNILAASRILRGVSVSEGIPSSERNTSHSNIRGTARPKVSRVRWFADDKLVSYQPVGLYGFGGVGPAGGFRALPYHQRYYAPYLYYAPGFPHSEYLVHGASEPYQPNWAPRRTIGSTISDIEHGVYWGVGTQVGLQYQPGYWIYVRLTSFTPIYWAKGVHIDYTYEVSSNYPWDLGTTVWAGRFEHHINTVRVGDKPAPTNWYGITDLNQAFTFTEKWTTTLVSVTNQPRTLAWFGGSAYVGQTASVDNTMGTRGVPIVALSESGMGPTDFIRLSLPKIAKKLSYESFSSAVRSEMGSIRASAYLSASDAMDELEKGVDTNLIEQLSQLSNLADYLPRLKQALDVVRSLHRKDLPGTVRGVLDLVTELRLRYAFSYAPDLDFVTSELPRLPKLIAEFQRTGSEIVVTRGVFNWVFPAGEFGRPYCTLETRTKLVAKRDNDSVLAKVLGVDSLGLLPSSSNAWDLVPLSFVVDWFANIGDRLSSIDNNVLLLLMNPSYMVHSYRVYSPLSEEELGSADLETGSMPGVDVVQPAWVVYQRDVSSRLPGPRSGKYDFLMPSRLPNWMTAGSLAWQFAT